jgi:hypothetical protein
VTAPSAPAATRLLKRDLFGSVTLDPGSDGREVVRRDWSGSSWWLRPLARHLGRREIRALRRLDGMPGIPRLLAADSRGLTREWIAGRPMQVAKPVDRAYFRAALRLLRQMHARGIVHNDLAKEPNWLVDLAGMPALVDFQLASKRRRGALSRALAHDDLRHYLKHKRSYLPSALSARERRILAQPSLPSRLWRATGKRVYLLVTRRLLGWRDREGAGDRLRKLLGPDWSCMHWYETAAERDASLLDMSRKHEYSRQGDRPALVFDKVEKVAESRGR